MLHLNLISSMVIEWLLNNQLAIFHQGEVVDSHDYIWIGDKCDSTLKLPKSGHLPVIRLPLAISFEPLWQLAQLLQYLLGENFIPAIGMIAGLLMALGYQKIVDHFGYCPTVIATGGLSCGKTNSLQSALSTVGCHK